MHRFTILLAVLAAANARNIHNRIFNGQKTTIEEHPYQVSIQHLGGAHFCAGCIVTPNRILTVSHCFGTVDKVISYHVRTGSTTYLSGGTKRKVESLKTHPKYNLSTVDFDVAVVSLKDSIAVSILASPIPIVPIEDGPPRPGEMLVLTGWGYEERFGLDLAKTLRTANIPAVNISFCESLYNSARFQLSPRVFCAGGGDQGPFKGDSGGPLVNAKQQVVGLVSWGHKDDPKGHPAIYTDLSNIDIRSFVDKNIA